MKRFKEVKADFTKIKDEVAAIRKMQADALATVSQEFETMLTSLRSLENKSGLPGVSML